MLKRIRYYFIYMIIAVIFLFSQLQKINAETSKTEGKKKKVIAVINFAANNTSPGISRIIRNSFELNLHKTGYFDLLEWEREGVLSRQKLEWISGCTDENCVKMVFEDLKANYIITGSIDKLDTYTINVKVVEDKSRRVVITESIEAENLKEIRDSAGELAETVADRINNIGKKRTSLFENLEVGACAGYQLPYGYFNDRVNPGYAVLLTVSKRDLYIKNTLAGIETGYMTFDGKDEVIHHITMVPIMLKAGYSFYIWKVSLVPFFSAGVSFNNLYYFNDYGDPGYSRDRGIYPAIKTELSVIYTFFEYYEAKLSAGYGSVFEKEGRIEYISLLAGVSVKL